MNRDPKDIVNVQETPSSRIPSGGVSLSQERLKLLSPQWEATYRSLRRMDELELGEMEPATLFVWMVEP